MDMINKRMANTLGKELILSSLKSEGNKFNMAVMNVIENPINVI